MFGNNDDDDSNEIFSSSFSLGVDFAFLAKMILKSFYCMKKWAEKIEREREKTKIFKEIENFEFSSVIHKKINKNEKHFFFSTILSF